MMPAGPAPPHIVVNTLDSLFYLLPLLEQRVVVRLAEERHPGLTLRAAAPVASAPLPEADDRAHADDRDPSQQPDHQRNGAERTALVRLAPRRRKLNRLVARRAQERIDA